MSVSVLVVLIILLLTAVVRFLDLKLITQQQYYV